MTNKMRILGSIVLSLLIVLTGCSNDKNTIESIEKEYVKTIVSEDDSSDKAYVYISKKSVSETAKMYIEWKKPLDHTDLSNNSAITLYYDDYIYVIYMNEDMETMVQKSSQKYIHHNGYRNTYRPYRTSIFMLNTQHYADKKYKQNKTKYGTSKQFTVASTNSTQKVNVGSNDSSKIQTGQTSGSVRNSSTTTRSHTGGGTSYGK